MLIFNTNEHVLVLNCDSSDSHLYIHSLRSSNHPSSIHLSVTYLPTYLPTYHLPTHPPTYLPTYVCLFIKCVCIYIQGVSKPMSQTFPGYSPTPLKQKSSYQHGSKSEQVPRYRLTFMCWYPLPLPREMVI